MSQRIENGRNGRPVVRKAEREELARLVRLRMKVAKTAVIQRQKELLEDVEAKLSAEYKRDHSLWSDITRQAESEVQAFDARIAQMCHDMGVPEEFRPGLGLSWYRRGENASAERRAELRKLAQAKIAALTAAANAAIEARAAEVMTELLAGGLESAEARAFLESLPTAEVLMLPLSLGELEDARRLAAPADAEDVF
jgi:hypothetical protein